MIFLFFMKIIFINRTILVLKPAPKGYWQFSIQNRYSASFVRMSILESLRLIPDILIPSFFD